MSPDSTARRAWTLFEPVHAIVYFAPESGERFKAAGLRGGWMGYFASRSAAMGAVGPEVVIAAFHSFHPLMVRRAIPDAWSFSTPQRALTARLEAADAALRRLWGEAATSQVVRDSAALLLDVAGSLSPDGRPLFAAHAALPVPAEPHLALWHACTLLREHRFEGHVAALTVRGVTGLDALVTAVAGAGAVDAPTMRSFRGWSEEEWQGAAERLRDAGTLDGDGRLTAAGREQRVAIEADTDRLAAATWDDIDAGSRERLFASLLTLAARLEAPGGLTYPNPIGVPRPD